MLILLTIRFMINLVKFYNNCIPLITKKICLDRPYKPWITKGIIKSKHKKSWLYKEAIKKNADNSISKYNIYKNKLIKIIRNAQKIYFVDRFNEAKDIIKNVWYVIKQLICPNSSKCFQVKEININGKVITDTTVMVDGFNSSV